MELLKSVADRHGLACLLHEKPFAGVNGSGKHNNWSIDTDTGINLLEPGETPYENAQFLLFLVAVIKAVDEHQDLLRVSVASAGNDHRLGANEAPPAIVSMFLGGELIEILEALESDSDYNKKKKSQMEIGVTALPRFLKDSTDRNRTSPFAFTGNKFEFRMLGSAFSIADPNIVLNTAVAGVLQEFADKLEKAEDFKRELAAVIKKTFSDHKRIIFNGNNYSEEWIIEAKKRGLSNLKTTVDALPALISKKSIGLFSGQNVFTEAEIKSRYEIIMEGYCKTLHIEALTMVDMVKGSVIPACIDYQNILANLLGQKKAIGTYDTTLEDHLLNKIAMLSASLLQKLTGLERAILESKDNQEILSQACYYRDKMSGAMAELRIVIDELETFVGREYWPFPTYAEMLYSVV
jgi:glutamine synthetase